MKSGFAKAEQINERIIQADHTQAGAYWGLILCKLGIECVKDGGIEQPRIKRSEQRPERDR